MAARSRAVVLCLLLVSFFILLCLRSHPLGLKEIAFWLGRFILILALITFILSVVTPYFNAVRLSGGSQAVPQQENEHHQEMARKEQQELLSKRASEYSENVLKPRQEEKLKKLEERFYKMTGQTWKLAEGYTLGVIILPEEPSESEGGVVTIALRCPSGRVYRRRFYKTYSSLVLLDWMMKIGYHPVFYSICMPMPRCPLELKENVTLENIGITRHTALNVEEKDH
ncbi:UBX domain-containing protein 8 isoform X5 [Phyllobates terribilis]|uniref:UBX domain-containing protein 8 isoform X5 n=1 Tax=Phyllobates terribilis TaxID=111132 RepID=UPI003CCB4CB0